MNLSIPACIWLGALIRQDQSGHSSKCTQLFKMCACCLNSKGTNQPCNAMASATILFVFTIAEKGNVLSSW